MGLFETFLTGSVFYQSRHEQILIEVTNHEVTYNDIYVTS